MSEHFWWELLSLDDDEELEKVIRTAQEQLNANRRNKIMKAMKKIFEGLEDLAEIDCKNLHIFEDDNDYLTVDELAKYFIDKYGF